MALICARFKKKLYARLICLLVPRKIDQTRIHNFQFFQNSWCKNCSKPILNPGKSPAGCSYACRRNWDEEMDGYISDAVVKRERKKGLICWLLMDGEAARKGKEGRKERIFSMRDCLFLLWLLQSRWSSPPAFFLLPFPSIPFSNSLLRSLIQFLQLVSFSHSSLLSNYSIL